MKRSNWDSEVPGTCVLPQTLQLFPRPPPYDSQFSPNSLPFTQTPQIRNPISPGPPSVFPEINTISINTIRAPNKPTIRGTRTNPTLRVLFVRRRTGVKTATGEWEECVTPLPSSSRTHDVCEVSDHRAHSRRAQLLATCGNEERKNGVRLLEEGERRRNGNAGWGEAFRDSSTRGMFNGRLIPNLEAREGERKLTRTLVDVRGSE